MKDSKTQIQEFVISAPHFHMSNVTIDTVIFGFHKGQLKVLLQRFLDTDYYVLPGGYIGKEENISDAAIRILKERTSLDNIYLEQFYTFGNTNRLNVELLNKLILENQLQLTKDNWFIQRYVSICYYSLVNYEKVKPVSGLFSLESIWFDVYKLPLMLFDHKEMIVKALETLQFDIDRKLNGFNLMGETFTMKELKSLYEAVFQKKILRANFQRKILGLDIVERLEKKFDGKAHKAPYLYRFKLLGK